MEDGEGKQIEVEACAKINIGLRVGPARTDGYHPIAGIFHSISLSDRLVVRMVPGDARILVRGDFDCPMTQTSVYRAAALFFRARPLRATLSIDVEKRIPAQAGLGGGSADAAAALVALDALCRRRNAAGNADTIRGDGCATGQPDAPPGRLRAEGALGKMALSIGADVPFFLKGGAAYVEGIGDIVRPIPSRTDFGLLVVKPPFGVSTKWAYGELDAARSRRGNAEGCGACRAADIAMFAAPPGEWRFANDFAETLKSRHPEYDAIEEALRDAGASFVSTSGSGSCMYGVFADRESAAEKSPAVRERLASEMGGEWASGLFLYAVKPLETSLFLR